MEPEQPGRSMNKDDRLTSNAQRITGELFALLLFRATSKTHHLDDLPPLIEPDGFARMRPRTTCV
jgi:hypothetical protein